MPIEAPKFNSSGVRGSKALSVGSSIITGGLAGGAEAAFAGSPGSKMMQMGGAISDAAAKGRAQDSADSMNAGIDAAGHISQPDLGEYDPMAMRKQQMDLGTIGGYGSDSLNPIGSSDGYQMPQFGSSLDNSMSRRKARFSL